MFERKGRLEHLMRLLYFVGADRVGVSGRLERDGPKENIYGAVPSRVYNLMSNDYKSFSHIRGIAKHCGLIDTKEYYTKKAKRKRYLLLPNKRGGDLLSCYGNIQSLIGMETFSQNNRKIPHAPPETDVRFIDLVGRRSEMEVCLDVLAVIKEFELKKVPANKNKISNSARTTYSYVVRTIEYMADERRGLVSVDTANWNDRYTLGENGNNVLKCLNSIVGVLGKDQFKRLYS